MAWSRAKKTIVDGITFPSRAEAKDYIQFKILLRTGEIEELRLQPKFKLIVNGHKIGGYTADFLIKYKGKKKWVIWERKGRESRDFRLRWKLCQALYPQYEYQLHK